MQDLLFSLNATLPVFCLILTGYFLKKTGVINEAFCAGANKLVFYVTLPALLMEDMRDTGIRDTKDLSFVLVCAAITIVSLTLIYCLGHRTIPHREQRAQFVQGAYRSSASILGVALIQSIQGDVGVAPLMILGAVPLYNVFAVWLLSPRGMSPGKVCLGILKNPILIGIGLGVLWTFLPFSTPQIFDKTIHSLAITATPVALLVIGATFNWKQAMGQVKPALGATAIKLVILPVMFVPVAIALGFTKEYLVSILVMLGSPTTPSSYVMARQMHTDATLSGSIVVWTTLLSGFTMTLWVYLLKSLGYIG